MRFPIAIEPNFNGRWKERIPILVFLHSKFPAFRFQHWRTWLWRILRLLDGIHRASRSKSFWTLNRIPTPPKPWRLFTVRLTWLVFQRHRSMIYQVPLRHKLIHREVFNLKIIISTYVQTDRFIKSFSFDLQIRSFPLACSSSSIVKFCLENVKLDSSLLLNNLLRVEVSV